MISGNAGVTSIPWTKIFHVDLSFSNILLFNTNLNSQVPLQFLRAGQATCLPAGCGPVYAIKFGPEQLS
jgi:hypothetical protein